MILIAGGLPAIVAVVAILGWHRYQTRETRLRDEARRDYDNGQFPRAKEKYKELRDDFPSSPNEPEYAFMEDLSDLRAEAEVGLWKDLKSPFDMVRSFLEAHDSNELLKPFARDLGVTIVKIVKDTVAKQENLGGDDLDVVEAAEKLVNLIKKELPEALLTAEMDQLAADFAAARTRVKEQAKIQEAVERVRILKPTIDGIKEARRIIEEEGLKDNKEAQELLGKLFEGHRQSIKYTESAAPPTRRAEDFDPSVVVDPLVEGHPPVAPDDDSVVLALVRGVLYALRQGDGEVKWALRVGIDTSELPVRVPRTPVNPELFLVLSADTATLTALDTDGQQVWRYRLSAPCLGRPVIVDRAAYVPTADGLVHEIELAKGKLVGRFDLGQPLSVGGVRQQGTKLVYFAADHSCVYVLDVDKHECQTVLYTDHLAGSLRGEPVIAAWTEPDLNGKPVSLGYLFLCMTDSPDAMQLRTYALPVQDPHAAPVAMTPLPRLSGWTWFPPHHDAEKLALVSDAGMLGLFGIRQFHHDEDNPLFPMVLPDPKAKSIGIDLRPFLHVEKAETRERGRAQIAHAAEENNFWVLAQGKLNRLRLLLDANAGPTVFPGWEKPLSLGSPLHASQVYDYVFDADGPRLTTLMLVTQSLTRQTCLASAVDAENGVVRWQRQLGLVCHGEPLVLGQDVLALDEGGGLFSFNSTKFQQRLNQWSVGGQALAGGLDDGDGPPPFLLPVPDGTSAYEIACPGRGGQLVVRRYYRREEGRNPRAVEFDAIKNIKLGDSVTLGGTPAVGAGGLLVPLSDGTSLRFTLDGAKSGDGPNWRGGKRDPELRTHVVWLNTEEFLTTDGGRGISRWHWPQGQVWETVPDRKENEPTIELPASIVSAPLVLPAEKDQTEMRVCVGDAAGVLWLLMGKDVAAAQKAGVGLEISPRHWDLGGKITAGPFFIGKDIGCIVDRRRLVRIDVAKAEPVWEYEAKEAIVGRPQSVEDILVVADQAGRYVGLNPETSRPRAPGYKLRASVAPAAGPVGFGRRQAFAPLTDGTVLLLSLEPLRDPLWGVPGF
jgi:outer membrane protein assembly factor BamB